MDTVLRGLWRAARGVLGACGAVCTAAAHVALTPLELVKTKLQTSAATSAVDVTKEIYEDDGLLALFAGWEPITVGYFFKIGTF